MRKLFAHVFVATFFIGSVSFLLQQKEAQAQDLKKELDALDDVPEDDLSRVMEDSDPLEKLPTEGSKKGAKQSVDSLPEDDVDPDLEKDNFDPDIQKEKKEAQSKVEKEEAEENIDAAESLTGAASEPTSKIVGLRFKQLPDRVRLTVSADRDLKWTRELRQSRRQVIVTFQNSKIARTILRRALDTGEFDGPVALVQAFESKTGVLSSSKILFQLRLSVDPTITKNGNDVYIDFPILDGTRRRDTTMKQDAQSIPNTLTSLGGGNNFKGTKVTFRAKDAPLSDVLQFLTRASGKDFIISSTQAESAKVTLNVRNMPWDQVLSIILLNAGLGYQIVGNSYRIMTIDSLKKEIDEVAASRKKNEELTPLETKIVPVSYASAKDIQKNLEDFKSKERGKISVDERTNTVIITDVPDVIEKMIRFVRAVDKQTSQVLIEARIVEASEEFIRSIGVNWKLGEITNARLSNSFVNMGKVGGKSGVSLAEKGETGTSGGGLLRIGNLGSLGTIQALLQLGEKEAKARIIASPRITTLNNKPAEVNQGVTQSFNQPGVGDAPPTTGFVNINTSFKVTPQVTSDGFVLLNIDLTREIPVAGQGGEKEMRSAKTQMLVESGKTGVLGGIYTINKVSSIEGWPWLRKFPIFGALFVNNSTNNTKVNELLMFVSPKILNSDVSLSNYGASDDLSRDEDKTDIDFSKLKAVDDRREGETL